MSFTANSTGGEYKHKLTIDEMPSHKHAVYIQNSTSNPQVNALNGLLHYQTVGSSIHLIQSYSVRAVALKVMIHLITMFNHTLQYTSGKGLHKLSRPSPKENNYIRLYVANSTIIRPIQSTL